MLYYAAAAAFVNCVYTVTITKEFRLLGTPLIVIFPLAARKTAHNNACDICHEKFADPPVLCGQLVYSVDLLANVG